MIRTKIIAEAGVNHNGDINIAKTLIKKAKDSGADIVKFQTFKAENLVSKSAPKAEYQKNTTSTNESQFEMIKKLELSYEDHLILIEFCKKTGIEFLSTPFDNHSIEMLKELGLDIFKIPSGEINNLPYLRKIGSYNKNVILSTGMSTIEEVGDALDILIKAGTDKRNITVLHCNTEYPTPYGDVNLHAMLTIKDTFGVKIGYSDHTNGIEVAIAAVALGAEIIEKHFTLDRNMVGPDHKASLEPKELQAMVKSIRNIEKSLGNGIKTPSPSEKKNIVIARKSIMANRDIKIGEVFSDDNLIAKRPGGGISPMMWDEVIGKIAKKNFYKDSLIQL
jgi:N,N'-diacetyllegionaminate synthase